MEGVSDMNVQSAVATPETPSARLRGLLSAGSPVTAPGVFNGLSARVAATVGFDCVYIYGSAVAASIGLAHVGLVPLAETIRRAEAILSAFEGSGFCDPHYSN